GFRGLGAIAPGYRADLLVADGFPDFHVTRVYRAGALVAADGRLLHDPLPTAVPPALLATMRLDPACVAPDAPHLRVSARARRRAGARRLPRLPGASRLRAGRAGRRRGALAPRPAAPRRAAGSAGDDAPRPRLRRPRRAAPPRLGGRGQPGPRHCHGPLPDH